MSKAASPVERARVRGIVGFVGAVVVLCLFEALVEGGRMWWKWYRSGWDESPAFLIGFVCLPGMESKCVLRPLILMERILGEGKN